MITSGRIDQPHSRDVGAPPPIARREPRQDREFARALTLRAAAGSPVARAAFVQRFLPMVRAMLQARWRCGPLATEVDDAVQEVFVEFLRPGGALARVDADERGGLHAYLAAVARHVALRAETRRGRRSREQLVDGFEAMPHPEAGCPVDRKLDRRWAHAKLREAITELEQRDADGRPPWRQRSRLLQLRYGSRRCLRALAEEWRVPAQTVYGELRSARRDLRRALRRVGAEASDLIRALDGS